MKNKSYKIYGSTLTSVIIAKTLEYFKKPYELYTTKKIEIKPYILLLNFKTDDELKLYFNIFNIDFTQANIEEYVEDVKVGYLYKGKVYDYLTEEMKSDYLKKQNRDSFKSSSMSDNLSSFKAINLKKVFKKLKYDYQLVNEYDYSYTSNIISYYTEVNPEITVNENTNNIYLKKNNNWIYSEYSYIYNCNFDSNIKRISKETVEFINYEEGCMKFENYYNEPKIIELTSNNSKHILLGRGITKSQFKQKDVIDFVIKELNLQTQS